MKKNYSKFLAFLLALAMILPGFTQLAMADDDMPEVIRISGKTRVETSIKVSQRAYDDGGASTVVLAGYNGEADALTGTLLAEAKDAPVLLTYKDHLDSALSAEIDRLGANKVYILGGTKVVNESVKTALEAKGLNVVRLNGRTRVGTAVKIAEEVFGSTKPDEAFFVEYNALADALAIGPVAAMKNAPILITYKDRVPADTADAINDMGIDKGTIIGGTVALPDVGKIALEGLVGTSIPRVNGSSRVGTSLAIANRYFDNPDAVIVANGWTLADALVGGYFGEKMNAPVLLSQTDNIHADVLAYIKSIYEDTYVLGGTVAISESVLNQIKEALKKDDTDPVPPIVPELGKYKIRLTAKDNPIVGDGKSNTTIEVQLVDTLTGEIGEVDGLQVRIKTTHGTLADERVTLQKGYGHTTLNSQAVEKRTDVDLDAQVIEGSVPVEYKDRIDGMEAQLGMVFTTPGGATQDDIPQVLEAESNQADRITLYFDRNVDPKEFTTANSTVTITQNGVAKSVRGFHRLAGNDPHTLQVILQKDSYLTDNKNVSVNVSLTRNGYTLTRSVKDFILTDNTKPQAMGVIHNGNMRTIDVYFSEAIMSAQFNLDGGTNLINNVTYGEFNATSQVDNRHVVTLDVEYLKPGKHVLQVVGPKDFAYPTDKENIGTTQEFEFTVLPNITQPGAAVEVESPEQYRIKLSNATQVASGRSLQDVQLQMFDKATQQWREVKIQVAGNANTYPDHANRRYQGRLNFNGNKKLAWVTTHGTSSIDELVMETNTDWTWVFDTEGTGENYYNNDFRIVIPEGTFRNIDNNLTNEKDLILPLDLELDDDSPELLDINTRNVDNGHFDLKFNEPVKAINIEEPQVGETPSQLQHQESNKLPNVVVEYRGKDINGNTVTETGRVVNYVANNGKDDTIIVRSNKNLRNLVDFDCYQEDWELIVRNVTDDIGNAAKTVHYRFKVVPTPAPAREFKITEAKLVDDSDYGDVNVNLPSGVNLNDYDVVRVAYSDFIRMTGNDDSAINKSNYKLNNKDMGEGSLVLVDLDTEVLAENSNGEPSVINCLCRYKIDGFHAVYLLSPKGTVIDTAGDFSNTVEVNKRLVSKNFAWGAGVQLSGPNQVELDYTSSWNGFGDCAFYKERD